MERTTHSSIKILVEGAMMIALATILSFIKVMEMPYGGSVTAASMVPILVFAYRWGGVRGIFVGAVYGIIQFLIDPYAAHPISVLLDYPIAFGALGVMGFFAKRGDSMMKCFVGVVVAIALRFVAHFLSGVIFFAMYAPEGMNPAIYSALYNGAYLLPEAIISCIVFALLYKQINTIQ